MDKLVITGGAKLSGEITVSGAKNAALPILCASLLTADDVHLSNVPNLQDVRTMVKLLRQMGVQSEVSGDGRVSLNASKVDKLIAPYEMVKTMRASILVLGPLVARFGEAKVSLPGGCAIGARPVDQHIKGLQAMGAEINIEHGFIEARAKRLKGARIITDMITVTGTENLLMAAVLAEGETVIENAAREPEVERSRASAREDGREDRRHRHRSSRDSGRRQAARRKARRRAGSHRGRHVPVRGRGRGRRCHAASRELASARRRDGEAARSWRQRSRKATTGCACAWTSAPSAVNIRTSEYPAFPTDMQAQFMALNTIANGTSQVVETIFENRFMHVQELNRLGAHITIDGNTALVTRRRETFRRKGHGNRSARVRESRDRGDVRGRRNADRPHLPSGSRLRPHGIEADGSRRERAPHQGQRERAMSSLPQTSSSVEPSAPLTLALSKGRIFEETLPLLAAAGVQVAEDPESSRKLILPTTNPNLRVIIVRATDVPTYVEYGAADFGVAGKDVLIEHGGSGLYQPIDLDIARCRMSVAVKAGFDYASAVRQGARLRVATKYTETARQHFAAKGVHVDLIKLYGSMELAPLVGLADAIVDLVSSGGTLRANNLVEVEEIMQISSRLVVNQAALKLKRAALKPYLDAFERATAAIGN